MNKEKLKGRFEDKMDFYRCSDVFLTLIRKNNCTIDKSLSHMVHLLPTNYQCPVS